MTPASLANVVHVVVVDYDAIQYGFPFPWLVYVLDTLGPVHRWIVTPAFILDYILWVAVAFAGLVSVSILKKAFEARHLSAGH